MVSTTCLETADFLEVFAFEEEFKGRLCWFLALIFCTFQCFGTLWCRSDVVQGCRCDNRCEVDVWFYACVGSLDGLTAKRWTLGNVSHYPRIQNSPRPIYECKEWN